MTVQIYNPKIALVKRAHHTLEPNFTTKTLQIIATNRDSDVKKIRKKVKKDPQGHTSSKKSINFAVICVPIVHFCFTNGL